MPTLKPPRLALLSRLRHLPRTRAQLRPMRARSKARTRAPVQQVPPRTQRLRPRMRQRLITQPPQRPIRLIMPTLKPPLLAALNRARHLPRTRAQLMPPSARRKHRPMPRSTSCSRMSSSTALSSMSMAPPLRKRPPMPPRKSSARNILTTQKKSSSSKSAPTLKCCTQWPLHSMAVALHAWGD